jgi:hypothetical protein
VVLSVINLGAGFWRSATGPRHRSRALGFALVRMVVRAPTAPEQEALDQNEQMQQTIETMEAQVRELEERVDFAERLVAQQKDAARLPLEP